MRLFILLLAAFQLVGCKDKSPPTPSASTSEDASQGSPEVGAIPKAVAQDAAPPDEVSEASAPYEPGPSVVAAESEAVDGPALRKKITRRIESDKSPVTLLQGQAPLELGRAICEEAVPSVPKSLPVLIKPNLGGYAGIKRTKRPGDDNGLVGRTTDPEFVRGVIHCLKARGHTRITVSDSRNADRKHWERLLDASGYRQMTEDEGVKLVAMSDDGVDDVEGAMPGKPLAISGIADSSVPTLLMPKILAEHLDRGLYIAIPKIKTHRFSVVSLGIKGLQGTAMYSDKSPAYRQKFRSHRELGAYTRGLKKRGVDDRKAYVRALEIFAERMTDILELEAPHVVLAEGAPAMSGDGFNTMVPLPEMVAIGGTNPVAVDAIGAQFLGLFDNADLAVELGGHRTSPLITTAAERFGLDLSAIVVRGNGKTLLEAKRPAYLVGFAPFEIRSGKEESQTVPIEKPEARALYTSSKIDLDGHAKEPFWLEAPATRWESDFTGAATGIVTVAKFAWNEGVLYGHFDLQSAGLNSDTSRPIDVEHKELYKEDCVEIFFTPDPARPEHYFEIEVGPFGHWLDIDVDLARKKRRFDQRWQSGVRIATTTDPEARRATIEIAIESPEIVAALRKGARLPIGLFRMEGSAPNKHYLAWSPGRTAKPKFHLPEAFGLLVLDGP